VQVSWLSLKTKVDGLSVVWPQNHWGGLASKPLGWFISGLASKPLGRFSRFALKIGGDGFSWFGLKTGGVGFSIWASKSVPIIW
jgi:hypothetical protein